MPTVTHNLGLKKPLGNETVSRAAYNENLDILDQNATKSSDFAAHLADNVKHTTQAEKDSWNSKETPAGAQAKADIVQTNLNTHKSRHAIGGADLLTPADIGAASSGHNHAGVYEPVDANIMRKNAAQTMAAQLTAQNNANYTTFQARNIVLSTADASGGGNGDVWIKYAP